MFAHLPNKEQNPQCSLIAVEAMTATLQLIFFVAEQDHQSWSSCSESHCLCERSAVRMLCCLMLCSNASWHDAAQFYRAYRAHSCFCLQGRFCFTFKDWGWAYVTTKQSVAVPMTAQFYRPKLGCSWYCIINWWLIMLYVFFCCNSFYYRVYGILVWCNGKHAGLANQGCEFLLAWKLKQWARFLKLNCLCPHSSINGYTIVDRQVMWCQHGSVG